MNNTSTLNRFDNSAEADHIFALFVYEEHEASGGIHDLKLTGSMLECVELALKSGHEEVSQIVGLPSMQLYRTGEWVRKQHPLVGYPASYDYEWTLHWGVPGVGNG